MTNDEFSKLTDSEFKVFAEYVFQKGLNREQINFRDVIKEARKRSMIEPTRPYNGWTKEELSQLMGPESAVELAKTMRRSPQAINHKRYDLRQKLS